MGQVLNIVLSQVFDHLVIEKGNISKLPRYPKNPDLKILS